MNYQAQALSMTPDFSYPEPRLKSRKKVKYKTRKKIKTEEAQLKTNWVSSIKQVELQLKEAYFSFNEATDPDLVDFSIYQINALHAKHNYLTRKLRANLI